MDLQQFGATVKQKYPQYNNYSDEEIGQKMLDKYPQYKSKVTMPSSGPLTTISNVLRGVGLGAIPDAAAAVTNIPNDIKNFNNPQAFKIGLEQNPFQDQKVVQQLPKGDTSQFRQNAANDSQGFTNALGFVNDASTAKQIGGFVAKKGGGLLSTAANVARYPTKRMAATATENSAEGATQAGSKMSWEDLANQIKKEVTDRLGNDRNVQKTLNKMLASRSPAAVESVGTTTSEAMPNTYGKPYDVFLGNPPGGPPPSMARIDPNAMFGAAQKATSQGINMTPSELLTQRRQLLERYGLGTLEKLTAQPASKLESKVAGIARGVITNNLHKLVPETIAPDQVYRLYSKGGKLGGDVPSLIAKYGGGYLAAKALGPILGPMLSSMANKSGQ